MNKLEKPFAIIYIILLFVGNSIFAQSVGIGTTSPNSSAALDLDVSKLDSNNKKGFLLPRVALLDNTDKTTIDSPAEGLLVFNTANAGVSPKQVFADTYYFWDGTKWTDVATITELKKDLLPEIFFIADANNNVTTQQNTVVTGSNLNFGPIVIAYSASSIVQNSNNNITFSSANNTFRINADGTYEISGFINYNPSLGVTAYTNLEFTIQSTTTPAVSSSWANITKTTGVWGYGTGGNSRSNNIAPVVISFTAGTYLRCVVQKTAGADHGAGARISGPTGLTYGKLLKIQKLN